jgi:hypothetical protein
MRLLAYFLVFGPFATLGSAQSNCLDQIKFPAQGRWAEFKASYKDEHYTVRYAVIGRETRAGKKLQWVEMRMAGASQGRNVIYQVLVPSSLIDMGEVQEIVVKPGDQPARKISGEMVQMIRGQLDQESIYGEMCKDVSEVGKEEVTVPGGSFQALHYHSDQHGSDSWVSPDVPFSLVRSTGKNYDVELVRSGEGATSSIKEKPLEIKKLGGPSH